MLNPDAPLPTFAQLAAALRENKIDKPVVVAPEFIAANVRACVSCGAVPPAERIIRVANFAGLRAEFDLERNVWLFQLQQ